ncbi:hypothetical protein EI42_02890 [Thermosporothrix hazakensis]|uniref:Transmembrane protein n=1 Tax=Thermosporothrix hazakensis TaxID=644383 RepID=A0A326U7B2_THEHA|nr:hypothetical protein [Thermosporothrix hazakensis]PZW29169.1 hypothetical protein EI42_02890 [Thermosporothrix hazakensis]GCE45480.1 hypothetical protein KTH_03490 [Thermosporothrix hazakensis]
MHRKNGVRLLLALYLPHVLFIIACIAFFVVFVISMAVVVHLLGISVPFSLGGWSILAGVYFLAGLLFFSYYLCKVIPALFPGDAPRQKRIALLGGLPFMVPAALGLFAWLDMYSLPDECGPLALSFFGTVGFSLASLLYLGLTFYYFRGCSLFSRAA